MGGGSSGSGGIGDAFRNGMGGAAGSGGNLPSFGGNSGSAGNAGGTQRAGILGFRLSLNPN